MLCPRCKERGKRNKIIQSSGGETKVRIDGPLFFKDGSCGAKCHWCGEMVWGLPIQIAPGTEIPDERFVVRNKG